MHQAGTISKSTWAWVDLLMVAVVVGFVSMVFATATGSARPLDGLSFDAWYWPLIAFAMTAFLVVTVVMLLGYQFWSLTARKSTPEANEPEHAVSTPVTNEKQPAAQVETARGSGERERALA